MSSLESGMHGPLYTFFADDHEGLEQLLATATCHPGTIDRDAYNAFRAGLLRHIGMEERVLLPAAQRARGGERLPVAERIRLDHGAIAALLVPEPVPVVLNALRAILEQHNDLEEREDGLYEACEELTTETVDGLLTQLRAMPDVRVNPLMPPERVLDATRRALARAGYTLDDFIADNPNNREQETE